jgi:hypothetical protein
METALTVFREEVQLFLEFALAQADIVQGCQ